jgi:hypothetical protein
MSGFKVGDLVVPLDITTRCDLSINKTYRITKIDEYGYVRVKNNNGLEPWYSPTRFKLAEKNMSTSPTISDLVDITDTHGDMIPRADIDYFKTKDSTTDNLGLTKDYHTKYTIKEYSERGIRHFCRPENVPVAATQPTPLEKGIKIHEGIIRGTPQVATSLSASTQNLINNPPQITNLCKEVDPPVKNANLFAYWITEPAYNTYTAVKKSVRYVVLWGVISGIGYTAYNPTGVASFIKSCLPKITVRYENEKVDG